jgi:branched-chain amino acid transport system ATP-binding protein
MLRADKIGKTFGGLTALEDISFSIRKNEITGIIGPNGAGKTTLFNIITGLYTQTAGSIFLNDRNISAVPPEKLARLGLVRTFQNIELFGQMTVLENVMVGLHTKSRSGVVSCALKLPGHLREERKIREKAGEWLDFCGLSDLSGVAANNLPFGKGRLLEIARAMALEPQIILMDEPAAGLNSRETFHLADLIRKIRDSGVTVVLVEHDMELIMDICDSIIVLNLGRKLAEGTPREIQENPEVIAAYLGSE